METIDEDSFLEIYTKNDQLRTNGADEKEMDLSFSILLSNVTPPGVVNNNNISEKVLKTRATKFDVINFNQAEKIEEIFLPPSQLTQFPTNECDEQGTTTSNSLYTLPVTVEDPGHFFGKENSDGIIENVGDNTQVPNGRLEDVLVADFSNIDGTSSLLTILVAEASTNEEASSCQHILSTDVSIKEEVNSLEHDGKISESLENLNSLDAVQENIKNRLTNSSTEYAAVSTQPFDCGAIKVIDECEDKASLKTEIKEASLLPDGRLEFMSNSPPNKNDIEHYKEPQTMNMLEKSSEKKVPAKGIIREIIEADFLESGENHGEEIDRLIDFQEFAKENNVVCYFQHRDAHEPTKQDRCVDNFSPFIKLSRASRANISYADESSILKGGEDTKTEQFGEIIGASISANAAPTIVNDKRTIGVKSKRLSSGEPPNNNGQSMHRDDYMNMTDPVDAVVQVKLDSEAIDTVSAPYFALESAEGSELDVHLNADSQKICSSLASGDQQFKKDDGPVSRKGMIAIASVAVFTFLECFLQSQSLVFLFAAAISNILIDNYF